MEYSLNPSAWNAMFPVPSSVVDEHIRLAGATQLKVLLCLLRHSNEDFDENDISKLLGLNTADIIDAMQYWVQFGILTKSGEASRSIAPAKSDAAEPKKQPVKAVETATESVAPIAIPKPTPDQIVARLNESPELKNLYSVAQVKLGRTIGYADQSSLLMMHDQYGLPVEVIIMIIDYAVSRGKSSISYILSIGKNWSENEIDTFEKAENRISELNTCSTLWEKFKQFTGIKTPKPTAKQMQYLLRWNIQLGYGIDMICTAYEEMANNIEKISFPYMDRIITNWYEQGIKTKQQLEKSVSDFREKKQASVSAVKQNSNASYDLNEFNRQVSSVPVYKKERN